MLSKRARNCQGSPTLSINAKTKVLIKEGFTVINFASGEPDFEPSEAIKKTIIEATEIKGFAKYTAVTGLPELKQAIIEKFKRDNNIDYDSAQIIVNCGAKHTLFNLMMTIIDDGDEVLILSPYWVSYPEQVILAGGKPVIVKTDDSFKVDIKKIEKAITKKTKAIIINSPSNPTGAVIEKDTLKDIGELAIHHNFYIISDEIYEKIIFDQPHISIASLSEKIKERTITVNGLSKSHAIPGLRIGFAGGPKEVINGMGRIQEQSTSNPVSIIQHAAITALQEESVELKNHLKKFKERRDYLVENLNKIGMKCEKSEGAFYLFPKLPVGFTDSVRFAEDLLIEAKIALVPGIYFGAEGYVRMSYTIELDEIKEGIMRLKKYIKND